MLQDMKLEDLIELNNRINAEFEFRINEARKGIAETKDELEEIGRADMLLRDNNFSSETRDKWFGNRSNKLNGRLKRLKSQLRKLEEY